MAREPALSAVTGQIMVTWGRRQQFKQAIERGPDLRPVTDPFYGDRSARQDPFGHTATSTQKERRREESRAAAREDSG